MFYIFLYHSFNNFKNIYSCYNILEFLIFKEMAVSYEVL